MTYEGQTELANKRFGQLPELQFTEVQAAWLAAIIDGEGSIGVWRAKRTDGGSEYKYNGHVSIANTNLDLMAHIKKLVGYGCICCVNRGRAKRDGHKLLFVFRVNNRAVPGLLRAILPYLIVKPRQAELVLRYYEAVARSPLRSSEDHEIFEGFYMQSKALNKRGAA